jgi:hypothetical protein
LWASCAGRVGGELRHQDAPYGADAGGPLAHRLCGGGVGDRGRDRRTRARYIWRCRRGGLDSADSLGNCVCPPPRLIPSSPPSTRVLSGNDEAGCGDVQSQKGSKMGGVGKTRELHIGQPFRVAGPSKSGWWEMHHIRRLDVRILARLLVSSFRHPPTSPATPPARLPTSSFEQSVRDAARSVA